MDAGLQAAALRASAPAAAPMTTTTAAPATPSPARGALTHGASLVDAGQGSVLAGGGNDLATVLGRLRAAIAELQRAIEAFARSVSGGGGLASPLTQNPLQRSPVQQSPAQMSLAGMAGSPVQGGGPLPTNAAARANAIPDLAPGNAESLRLAGNQTTYREITVSGGPAGTTIPVPTSTAGLRVELFALRDHQRGAHSTQVLEPVNGAVTVPPGASVRLIARVVGVAPGPQVADIAGARLQVHVGAASVDALPMMAWVNEAAATKRGASAQDVASVLAHFGVAATGNSGVAVTSVANRSPVQYFSAAYEAATRSSPAEAARRIVEAERSAAINNPGAAFWVQVSDEQDKDASQVAGTVQWIAQLRTELAKYGSGAKLFVAAQARDFNLPYASVIDGWATTQSSVAHSRDSAISHIQGAAAGYGRTIELMEYPGNAFFDAGTVGSAAVSTASAALDGASSWFLYSANNLDTLEQGGGDEGRGDIGGLVAMDGGRVLPTIALIEAELGANLGAAARTLGGTALATGASQVAAVGDQLDAYKHTGQALDLRAWEYEIGHMIA